MITTTDIGNILYRDCATFGIERFQGDDFPTGEITDERIIIHSKAQQPGKIWKKSFAEVNLCVPDDNRGNARLVRLNELDREAECLDGVVGEYDGTPYHYSISAKGVEIDSQMRCHYVNVKILFEVLNIK